ncbi:hypothetical protein YC2023_110117 [Brassica napus]
MILTTNPSHTCYIISDSKSNHLFNARRFPSELMVEKSYPSSSWKRTFAKGFMSCFMETKFISSGGTVK